MVTLRGNTLNIVALLGVVMPAIMTFGYNQSLLGGVLTFPDFGHQFPQIDTVTISTDKSAKSLLQGTVVALYAAGGLFGAVSCVWLGDSLGRRRMILGAAVIQIVGAIIMASASSLPQLIVSRILVGFGTGGLLCTVPVWQSEISPASKRGSHVVTTGIFIGMGLSLSLFLDFGFSFVQGSASWRVPFAFQILLSLTTIGFIAFLPDSPRWLLRKGRVAEARQVLSQLDDIAPNSSEVDAEIRNIQSSLELAGDLSLGQIFTMGPQRIFHRAMLASSILMFLQLTGVNAITFYTTKIFQDNLLLGSVESRILSAIYQVVSPIGGVVCIFTIERFGRRGLMLSSAAGNAICLALVAGLGSQTDNKHAMNGAVFFTFFYHFTYVLGFGGIPFLYATEVAPLHLRAAISGISVGTFWAFNFLLAEVTPIAFDAIQWRYFIIFAALNAAMIPTIYYFFPETAERSLEDMDEIFCMSKSIFDPVRVARSLPRGISNGRGDLEGCAKESSVAQVEDIKA